MLSAILTETWEIDCSQQLLNFPLLTDVLIPRYKGAD